MIKLTTLYSRESKSGKRYLAGRLGNLNIMVFKDEKNKTDEGQDIYSVMLDERKESKRDD